MRHATAAFIALAVVLASAAAALDASFLGPLQFEVCGCGSHPIGLSVEGASGPVTLSANHPPELSSYVPQPPMASRSFVSELTVAAACDAAPGAYQLEVTASDSVESKTLTGVVMVADCNSLGLTIVGTAKTCDYVEYTLQAVNNANQSRRASVSTNINPVSQRISQSELFLPPYGKANFTVTISPRNINDQLLVSMTINAAGESATTTAPLKTPLCAPSGAVSYTEPNTVTYLTPSGTGTEAASVFSFPAFGNAASNVTGFFTASRFTLPIAIVFILLLLAAAFLYFRYKYDESADEKRKEQDRRERAKRILIEIERRH